MAIRKVHIIKGFIYFLLFINSFFFSQYLASVPRKHIKNFGIYLYDLNNKKDIFVLNSFTNFIPASNQKLLLVAAILQNISIDNSLCNKFYITENTDGSIEINIVGWGAFNENHKNPEKEFELFYEKYKNILKSKQIKKINLDSSIFDGKTKNIYWDEHNNLEWWLPIVSPFIFNSNLLNIKMSYKNGKVSVKQLPFDFLKEIDVSEVYCLKKCNINLLRAEYISTTSLKLRGPICCNKVVIKQIPVGNPALYYAQAFINFLQSNGVDFKGEKTFNKVNNKGDANFEYCSSLKELIRDLIKSSDNLVAETLLKYLGYVKYGEGSFEKGTLAIFEFVKSIGPTEGTIIVDGAGISRTNRVSPYILVKSLEFIYNKLGQQIYDIFPRGGEKKTTLKARFKKFPADIWAKTGFLNNVYALTGIIKKGRKIYLFSIIYNGNLGKWKVYGIQEKVLKQLIKG